MNPFDAIRGELADLRDRLVAERTTLRLGTVTAALDVILADGSTVTPAASLVALVDGDRVLTATQSRRLYVLGKVQ